MNIQDIGFYMGEYQELIMLAGGICGFFIVKYGICGLNSIFQNMKQK